MMMKPAMPVSPYPTFPRRREKEQTNRYASFTLTVQPGIYNGILEHGVYLHRLRSKVGWVSGFIA